MVETPNWRKHVKTWMQIGEWDEEALGPAPNQPKTYVPPDILKACGIWDPELHAKPLKPNGHAAEEIVPPALPADIPQTAADCTPPTPQPEPVVPRSKVRDANDLLRQHGPEAVRAMLDAAVPENPDTTNTSSKKPSNWRNNLIDPKTLCDRTFPEVQYVVPGIFPEGVILLVSRPKLGKSWLLLQITTAISSGTVTLAVGDPPVLGDVLYLALEDTERRLQRRMTKYFGAQRENWPARLKFATSWRRIDQGGLEDLRDWCRSVAKPTLIAIDVLKKIRPPRGKNQSDYEADYSASEGLMKLVGEFPGLTVVIAHHDRKMEAEDIFDTVSGTLGLTGGVDTIAVLKRSGKGITLHVEGRDLVDPVEKAINFDRDTCRWHILGEAAEVHRSAERFRVLVALADQAAGLAVAEIQTVAELGTRAATDKLLSRMVRDGEIVRLDRGRYALPEYMREIDRNSKEYGETTSKTHTPGHTPGSDTSDTSPKQNHTPAVEFLTWALTPGPRLVRDIEASAREGGLLGERQRIDNAKSFQDAKSALKVVVEREGFGHGSKVHWRLPDSPDQGPPNVQIDGDPAPQTPEHGLDGDGQ
jgi:hypothetical protein